VGAWVPWPLAERLCHLGLRTPSHWRVFLAVLLTAARYGGPEAYLVVADLVRLTGLGTRTVKGALARLVELGLLARTARCRRLRVTLGDGWGHGGGADELAPRGGDAAPAGGADKLAPPRCRQACTSPTSFISSCIEEGRGRGTFSRGQVEVIDDVLAEATELLGADAGRLTLPDAQARRLNLPTGATYSDARAAVEASGDRRRARDFTRAALALRQDQRVQGEELGAPGHGK
jgi:hypothetical protein